MAKIITLLGNFDSTKFHTIPRNQVIAVVDPKSLHKYIIDKVANELQYLSEDCYYPRVSDIFKELLVRCQTTEKKLNEYADSKFKVVTSTWKIKNPKIVFDTQNVLLILILQEFLHIKDFAAALSTINLISLRQYSNLMHRQIRYCNPDYFRTAMNRLSHNHLYSQKKTIGNAILYLAEVILQKYKLALESDDIEKIILMLYEHRTRLSQSIKSFAEKYYAISEDKDITGVEKEELPEKQTLDKKFRLMANKISKEIAVYGLVDNDSLVVSQKITKQNSKLAREYIKTLPDTKFAEPLELAIYFFLKEIDESKASNKLEYMEVSRKLMSIKVTNKPVYYKKIIIGIHDTIVKDLGYMKYFDRLSIQSKGMSRRFLSLYIAVLVFNFLNAQ
jgi:hypothetical protein